jgi:phosphatidylglycerol---prolipoprotein diacylglyceryl transferase
VHPVLFHIGAVLIPAYGAMAAVGVLAGLVLAQRTARVAGVAAGHVWNLCVVAVCAALVCERLLLVAANWSALRSHPAWTLGLAMIHHPLVAGAGAAAGLVCAAWYARMHQMPLAATADALAGPLSVGLTLEQLGALLAGSGYGTAAAVPWAVTYTSPLAALWSGTPLGIALHPVQAYAALAFLALAVVAIAWLPRRGQAGDVAGLWLMGAGAAIYFTELWRDPEGRGAVLHGALDGPQVAAVAMVVVGALVLRERESGNQSGTLAFVLSHLSRKDKNAAKVGHPFWWWGEGGGFPPFRQKEVERMGHGDGGGGAVLPDSQGGRKAGPSTSLRSAQDDREAGNEESLRARLNDGAAHE